MREPLHVALPLGIGDCWWSCQKLRALSELHQAPIIAHVSKSPNHQSVGFLQTIPWILEAVEDPRAPYAIDRQLEPSHRDPRWSTLEGCANWEGFDYIAVANGHLERGERIESWWPELSTDYICTLNIAVEDIEYGRTLAPPGSILLYLSGTGPNSGFHGGTWTVDNWVGVIAGLNAAGIRPVLVGAPTPDDTNYRDWVVRKARRYKLEFGDAVGQTTQPQVLSMIREAGAIAGLNSGLLIVGSAMGTPTVMCWANARYQKVLPVNPAVLLPEAMATSWLAPEQLEHYRVLSYGSPELTPEALVQALLEVRR